MAIKLESKCMSAAMIKAMVTVMGLALFGYIIGPPLYWHLTEALTAAVNSQSSSSSSCLPCVCDCSSQHPLLSVSQGLSNTTFPVVADCAKRDSEVSEETERNFSELLSEDLKLREAEALKNQQRADMALLEAKKLTSQYQKEADKCNSGMETCEEAREKAEAALAQQRKVTAIWEQRAREKGWREGMAKPLTRSQ